MSLTETVGLCVQTPQMEDEWVCSRFRENNTKGFAADIMTKILEVKMIQRHAILWYFPIAASISLLIAWILWWFMRDRVAWGRKIAKFFMAVSCAAGLAAAMALMMVGNTLFFVGPVYGSKVESKFNVPNIAVHWTAFGLGLAWILLSQWYDDRVRGPGCYNHGSFAEEMGEV